MRAGGRALARSIYFGLPKIGGRIVVVARQTSLRADAICFQLHDRRAAAAAAAPRIDRWQCQNPLEAIRPPIRHSLARSLKSALESRSMEKASRRCPQTATTMTTSLATNPFLVCNRRSARNERHAKRLARRRRAIGMSSATNRIFEICRHSTLAIKCCCCCCCESRLVAVDTFCSFFDSDSELGFDPFLVGAPSPNLR